MRWILVSAVGAVMLAGCVASPEGAPTPTPTRVTTPAVSPTSSPVLSPSPTAVASYPADLPTGDADSAAIIAGWQDYWRVYEKFAADPTGFSDLTQTQYVTSGEESRGLLDRILVLKREELRAEGGLQFRSVQIELGASDGGSPRQATLTYCANLDEVKVFSVDTGEQLPRRGTLLATTLLAEGADGKWRVAQMRNQETAC